MYSGKKLKSVLDWQGRTQSWLAEQTGVSESNISRYLSDRVPMTTDFAHHVARLLDVPVDMLLTDQPAEKASA